MSSKFIEQINKLRDESNLSNEAIISQGGSFLGEKFVSFAKKYFEAEAKREQLEKQRIRYDWPSVELPSFSPTPNSPDNLYYYLDYHNIEFTRLLDNDLIFIRNKWQLFTDNDRADISTELKRTDFDITKDSLRDFIISKCNKSEIDLLSQFLRGTTWDNKDRILELYNTLNSSATGEDREFEFLLFKKWFHGYVSLTLDIASPDGESPRQELMIILQGPEGTGKTQWTRKLLPPTPISLFHEGPIDPNSKDDEIKKSRVILWIASEFEESLGKHSISAFKEFLTSEVSLIRGAYAEKENIRRKRCSFVGSTNGSGFIPPGESNRRFIVIETGKIDYKHQIDMRQVFAQVIFERKVNGFRNWLNQEEIKLNSKRLEKWIKVDSLHSFIDQLIETGEDFRQPLDSLWSGYIQFCRDSNHPNSHINAFKERLKSNGFRIRYNKVDRLQMVNCDLKSRVLGPK